MHFIPRVPRHSAMFPVLWLFYALFIVYVTTLPFQFELDVSAALEELSYVPLNPFVALDNWRPSITDMVQNVVLFVPFGILGMLSIREKWGRVSFSAVGLVTALGAALSVAVEVLQLFTPYRITSTNDVMTNTAGTCLGAMASLAAAPLARPGAAILGRMNERARAAFTSVVATSALLIVSTWHPFDASLRLGSIASKIRSLLADPWQVGIISVQGTDCLRYALFAAAIAIWMHALGVRRPVARAAAAGIAAAFCLELSQLVIRSRMPGLADALVGAAGASVGAVAGLRMQTWSPGASMGLLVLAGWLTTAMMLLSPYELAEARRAAQWTPFLNYLGVPPGRAASHIAELALAFAPVGYGLRRLMPGTAGWGGVVTIAFMLGGTLEYLQGAIDGRYPDITDVVMLTGGAVLGAGVAGYGRARGPGPRPQASGLRPQASGRKTLMIDHIFSRLLRRRDDS